MQKTFPLTIITPSGQAYSGDVVHSRIPTINGSIGILANHASLVTASEGGTCVITEGNGQIKSFKVGEGFFSVAQNRASFLTRSIEDVDKNV